MNGWKAVAIVFIVLFIVENLFLTWAVFLAVEEEDDIRDCYYDICSEYADAWYEDKVCYCYDYDLFGEPEIVKTEVMD